MQENFIELWLYMSQKSEILTEISKIVRKFPEVKLWCAYALHQGVLVH